MLCYLRDASATQAPIANAAEQALIATGNFCDREEMALDIMSLFGSHEDVDALVVMTGDGREAAPWIEEHVPTWAQHGGYWVFGGRGADAWGAISAQCSMPQVMEFLGLCGLGDRSAEDRVSEERLISRPTEGGQSDELDLRLIIQRRAAERAADFVEANFQQARPFDHPDVLLREVVSQADVGGLFLEFGVYNGRTIRQIADTSQHVVYGFDSFLGLPEDWRPDFPAGSFATPVRPSGDNIVLVEGWFSETLPGFLQRHRDRVSFVHIDCDLYSSTSTVLRNIGPRLGPGSLVLFDEYLRYPGWEGHEHRAWLEHVAAWGIRFEYIGYVPAGEQVAVRILGAATA